MKLINKIHYHLSASWRIRRGYGLEPIRNLREARALYEFCIQELAFRDQTADKNKTTVLMNTCTLYQQLDSLTPDMEVICTCPRCKGVNKKGMHYNNFYDYVEDHCGWYWN